MVLNLTCPIPRPSLVLLVISAVILICGVILYPILARPFEETTLAERSKTNLTFHVVNTTLLVSLITFLFCREFLKVTKPKTPPQINGNTVSEPPK